MARELTLICPGPESPRLSALLAAVRKAHPFQQVSWMTDDLRDRRLLIAAAIPPSGVNLELYQLLAFLRTHPGCLAGSTAGVVIDGTGDLYTKAAGRDLVLSASQAGCVFPGRPLVEATGSLRNFTVQARNAGCGLEEAYQLAVADLMDRVSTFSPPLRRRPQLLVLQHPDDELTAPQQDVDIHPRRDQTQLGQGRHRGTGPGAAGPGLAAAPLPHPHFDAAGVQQLDKLGVDLLGEVGMLLKGRADGLQVQGVHVLHHRHTVGVAHTDAGDLPALAGGLQGAADQGSLPHVHGGQVRRHGAVAAHLHLPQPRAAAAHLLLPAEGVDAQEILAGAGRLMGVQPLGHAADAVAAHHPFAAVGVEDPHGGVGVRRLGCADTDHAVPANGEPAGRQFPGQAGNVLRQAGGAAVQVDIIVGTALHLGKGQLHSIPPIGFVSFIIIMNPGPSDKHKDVF